MTQKYKTGVWIAHNGEPQPVHDLTVVKLISAVTGEYTAQAKDVEWNLINGAFQVVTPHVEPREFIVTIAPNGDLSVHHCENPPSVQHEGCEYVTVREVV